MCRCQEWRPALARLAGEASPAQPWAALAWLGLDNHGGGDGGDQADGDGGGDDDGGGDGGGGAACEVPEVRCSAARTQDTSHRHQPALVQPGCITRLLTGDIQTAGLGSVSSLVSSTQCCSAIVHCGKCVGVGWCKSVVPVSGELLRQLWLVCGGAATAASPARRSSALSCTAHSHGSGGAQCTVCSGHLAGGQGAHHHQAGHQLQGAGGGQGAARQ